MNLKSNWVVLLLSVVAQKLRAVIKVIAVGTPLSARAGYPIVSQHYAADPAAVEFTGRLYVYCSDDDDNGTNGYIMS